MKVLKYAAAVVVAAGITVGGPKPAYADLVFENDLGAQPPASQPAALVPTATADSSTSPDMSKAEIMRRQRLRQEMKNEDILTQKLEELRLKDEMKRTDELTAASSVSAVGKSAPVEQPLQEQTVGSAVTPVAAPAAAATGASAESSATNESIAAVSQDQPKSDSQNHISIAPKFGTSSITSNAVNVSAKWGAGVDVGFDLTENISILGGYTYSTYSLAAGNNINYGYYSNTQSNMQTLNLNDNVISLGGRYYLGGHDARLRPFAGAGGSYRRGYINYDGTTQQLLTNLYGSGAAQDVTLTGMQGYVEAGAELKVTGAISIIGSFRYYDMISSSQSNPINPNAYVGPAGYSAAAANPLSYNSNTTASAAGNALAGQNFFQLMGGIQVTF